MSYFITQTCHFILMVMNSLKVAAFSAVSSTEDYYVDTAGDFSHQASYQLLGLPPEIHLHIGKQPGRLY